MKKNTECLSILLPNKWFW